MRVIIVGAGIGGLAAALTLGRVGVAAALRRYEAIRKPRASRCGLGSRGDAVVYHMPDGEERRRRDADFAGATSSLAARSWLYAYDAEAAMDAAREVAQ